MNESLLRGEIMTANKKGLNRREFLKYSALIAAGFALPNCAGLSRFEGYNPYNSLNPNFKGPGHQNCTFRDALFGMGWVTPGIDYKVSPGTPMVAVADGFAMQKKIPPQLAAGWMVVLEHRPTFGEPAYFLSYYAHIESVKVKLYQKVARGDVIGYGGYYYDLAKLMLRAMDNFVDPDNYGLNHSYMNYWDGKTNLEIADPFERIAKQFKSLQQFAELCTGKDVSALMKKVHTKTQPKVGTVSWSIIEQFRCLEYWYTKHPEYFSAPKEEIDNIRKEFYNNQPIILTLPFKRP